MCAWPGSKTVVQECGPMLGVIGVAVAQSACGCGDRASVVQELGEFGGDQVADGPEGGYHAAKTGHLERGG